MQHKDPEFFARIENYINEYQLCNGYAPTNAEISRDTGLSTATVSRYIAAMKEAGLLAGEGHRTLMTRSLQRQIAKTREVPIVGSISCGPLLTSEENIEDYLNIPVEWIGSGEYFFLRASGESMIDAGISDGDLVLIRKQSTARQKDIAVVLADGEVTLKRYFVDEDTKQIRLHPENPTMEDIFVKECDVQGVAVKVVKDIG